MFKLLDLLAIILVILSGINWFFIGLINVNLIERIFLDSSWFTRAVYLAFGAASVYVLIFSKSICRRACK
ncbi:MAG: hypothetical protein S4CHLAM102_00070 [Chlamydiia bacterium]|nr:hypothetical protein [Chlamydiia bacterium]